METQIGKQFILWEEEYSDNAYLDQFNIPHSAYVVLNEFIVTVIEEKPVRGMWGGDEYTGIKATTKEGKIFTRNWYSFPDDSITPTYYWDIQQNGNHYWQPVDSEQANELFLHVDKNGNKK